MVNPPCDSHATTLSIVVLLLTAQLSACGGDPSESPSPARTYTALSSAPTTLDDALAELRVLHAGAVGRALDGLSPAERATVAARFAETADHPGLLRLRFTAAGTPRDISAPGFAVLPDDLGLPATAGPRSLADAFVHRFAAAWGVPATAFDEATVDEDVHRSPLGHDVTTVIYRQRHGSLPVIGAFVAVHVGLAERAVIGVSGSFLPIAGLHMTPVLDAPSAAGIAPLDAGERAAPPRLVVWSEFRTGRSSAAHLAWQVPIEFAGGGLSRVAYLDAMDGRLLARYPVAKYSLRRSLWDERGRSGYDDYTCTKWAGTAEPWPTELDSCPAQCTPCRTDQRDCALCTCWSSGSPVDCELQIWRYDETLGCVANGDPPGEQDCALTPDATKMWKDLGVAWNYWSTSFLRDSWDGAGAWVWGTVRPDPAIFPGGGRSVPVDVAMDGTFDAVHTIVASGAAATQLDGHELGHVLQWGTQTFGGYTDAGFHDQGNDAAEHNADAHGFRYAGGGFPAGYRCDVAGLAHHTQFHSWNASQENKFIGNCHGWLMSQNTGSPITHYGVSVTPMSLGTYDQVWYRNLDVYRATNDDYFDWWNDMATAAYDLYGFGAPYDTALAAARAIGSWTGFAFVSQGVPPADRYAVVGWPVSGNVPCVFFRYSGSPQIIRSQCWNGTAWSPSAWVNDPAVDPAASEPAATFRYESGTTYIYVLWRGTDNRIRYRRITPATWTIGPAQSFGATMLTAGVPAAAPIFESGALDRLVVVYHPLATPTTFSWTYLGAGSAWPLGAIFNSDAAPAMAPYPYYNRIYLVRPNLAGGSTSRNLQYASYTLAGGWSSLTNLTTLFNADTYMPPNVVRSDRAVALAEYGSTMPGRLRMAFVTMGDGTDGVPELWYATLRDNGSGALLRDDYRAVPLSPLASPSQSAGGLGAAAAGYPLFHLWGNGGGGNILYEWRAYSN